MLLEEKTRTGNEPCNPEWFELNRLLTYCAKSVSQPMPGAVQDAATVPDGARLCNRNTCVFGFRKK
jgi:hypothetical protein